MTCSGCGEIDLCEFTVGEIPSPVEYQFQDSTGGPLDDLTGYTAKFIIHPFWGAPTTYDATVTSTSEAKVTYTWVGGEFPEPGPYNAEFWIGNGTQRYASKVICWIARMAQGPVPAI